MPASFETDADRAEYLLYEGLTHRRNADRRSAKPGFADRGIRSLRRHLAGQRWLLAEVVD